MPTRLLQDLAALSTAALWALSALAWSAAGRRVGSVPVTAIRIVLAALILLAVHWVAFGRPWPAGLTDESFLVLAISGLLGAFAADLCLFRGLVLIGPQQGMLIGASSPFATAILAWILIGEQLSLMGLVGLLLTAGGIIWVLAEQKGSATWPATRRQFAVGVLLCVASVVLLSGAHVLSRIGLTGEPWGMPQVAPFSAAVVRVAAAALATVVSLPALGRTKATLSAFGDRRAMLIIVAGTIAGPVVGIWMSMIALGGIKAGIAAALITLSPLMLIPIVYFVYGERPRPRALLGTCIALAGVFVLVLR